MTQKKPTQPEPPDHLDIWATYGDVPTKHTKKITGRPYSGVSPNPQYLIRCMTEHFGKPGDGFGWDVVAENFERLGDAEVLHWCRIRFWHGSRDNHFDAYGQTKAAYVTRNGSLLVDEDAPKKSITDAITKAASQLGFASNIFLGLWDDAKYVHDLREREREQAQAEGDASRDDASPPAKVVSAADMNHERFREVMMKFIEDTDSVAGLVSLYNTNESALIAIKESHASVYNAVVAAFTARRKSLETS